MLSKNNKLSGNDLENINGGAEEYGKFHVRCYECEHDAGKAYHEINGSVITSYAEAQRLAAKHTAETSHTNIDIKNSMISA